MRPFRPSVRLRLTALYGALFLAAGIALLALNYVLVRRNLPLQVEFKGPSPIVGDFEEREPLVVPAPPEEVERLEAAAEDFRQQTLDQLLLQSGLALGLTAVAAVGFGWIVAGRVLRPVHEITAAARRLSEQNLHERLALQGPQDELKELADTFDAMLGRLDAAFESQGRFVANAAHELRTPLSIMRTELEVAQADPDVTREQLLAMATRVQTVIDRTEHVVEGLLTLARSAHGIDERRPVDLAAVAEVATAELDGELRAAGVDLRVELEPALTEGDGGLLEHLAANLVTNAARYNVDGGWVEVRTRSDGGEAVLEVANSGPVIDVAAVDTLFEPFRRNAPDRTSSRRGAGLGLSIVRAVADAHGGTVRLEPLRDGGLRATVRLSARNGATA